MTSNVFECPECHGYQCHREPCGQAEAHPFINGAMKDMERIPSHHDEPAPVERRESNQVDRRTSTLSHISPAERKAAPMCSGLLDYFHDALADVARNSKIGNDQHNPGEPLHWARGKSMDEADCIIRHLVDRGRIDSDGVRHTTKAAWRILALLQKEIEADEGLPISRGSWAGDSPPGSIPAADFETGTSA